MNACMHPSAHPFFCLSIHPSIHASIHPRSPCMPVCTCKSGRREFVRCFWQWSVVSVVTTSVVWDVTPSRYLRIRGLLLRLQIFGVWRLRLKGFLKISGGGIESRCLCVCFLHRGPCTIGLVLPLRGVYAECEFCNPHVMCSSQHATLNPEHNLYRKERETKVWCTHVLFTPVVFGGVDAFDEALELKALHPCSSHYTILVLYTLIP